MSSGYPFNIRTKSQRSRSQGHKVQKHTEGDQMAGVSYVLYRLTTEKKVVNYK